MPRCSAFSTEFHNTGAYISRAVLFPLALLINTRDARHHEAAAAPRRCDFARMLSPMLPIDDFPYYNGGKTRT
jgi:hypothetical protein